MSFVYFIADQNGHFKIGLSHDPASRLIGLQTCRADTLELLGSIPGDAPLEKAMHRHFKKWHVQGEWFHSNHDSLEEVGRVLANPPKPSGIIRGKRRLSRREDIVLAERIAGYLRGKYVVKPSYGVSTDTGIEETTIRTWLQGNSLPSAEMLNVLVEVYGPTFVAAVLVPNPQWVIDAVLFERQQTLAAEIERLRKELAELEHNTERAR